jgi:hypothetical protein
MRKPGKSIKRDLRKLPVIIHYLQCPYCHERMPPIRVSYKIGFRYEHLAYPTRCTNSNCVFSIEDGKVHRVSV